MRWHHHVLSALACLLASPALPADWITAPSQYTHDWSSGQRVAQYSPIGPFYYYTRPDYLKSGYRQYRSTVDLGNSSDNMHIVEQWGAQIVPYEQWRFPYRPYSAPYQAWGPPYGGLGGGTGGYPYSGGNGANVYGGFFPPYGGGGFGGIGGGFGGYGGFAAPGGGMGGGGFPGGIGSPATNTAQPWLDGHYPQYDLNDRSQYWRPYNSGPGGSGGGGGMGGGGGFPGGFGAPATNTAQPWLDGHYPQYDLNDRSQYWRPYQSSPGSP
jgi:hypothetical protein